MSSARFEMSSRLTAGLPPSSERTRAQTIILLRWVLIIATSYLMLFSGPLRRPPASVALFIAAYFASNLVLARLLPRIRSQRLADTGLVLFDTVAICVALALTASISSDFFLLYFLVVFLGALTQRLGLVVCAAAISGIVHLATLARFVDFSSLVQGGYLVRVPFLFVVALFFGHLVEEEAQTRERMRSEVLSTITHDLKNALGAIESLAELLLDGNAGRLNEDQMGLVRRIHASARRIIKLSLNLLDVGRIEAGRLDVHRTPQDLAEVVEAAVALERTASDLKGVALEYAAEPNLPRVNIDFTQMERVVTNLLDNAIKHTPAGGAVVVSARRAPGQVVFAVRDNGSGVAPDQLPLLFQKYRVVGGSGLGLFIVKALVEAHDGTVEVESTLGQGTAVTVRLPNPGLDSEQPPANLSAGQ